MKRLVFLDIETHPTRNPFVIERLRAEALGDPPKSATKAERLEWNTEENRNHRFLEKLHRTAVSPLLAEVLVTCIAFDGSEVYSYEAYKPGSEGEALAELRDVISELTDRESIYVGHNVAQFDLAVLLNAWRRHSIQPPPDFPSFDGGRWHGRIYDTMRRTPGPDRYVSMEEACEVCGVLLRETIYKDQPMHGGRVLEAFEAGAFHTITEYCRQDVIATRSLYLAMTAGDSWGTFPRRDELAERLAEIEQSPLSEAQKALSQKQVLVNAGRWPG